MHAKPRILVADDEVDYLTLSNMLLKKQGYDVFTVSSGKDFLEVTRNIDPDVIVLDVRLGPYDGRQLCLELKNSAPVTPIVILHSAYHDVSLEFKSYGADDFIRKPYPMEILLQCIGKHLGHN